MRTPLIVGNWKMNLRQSSSIALVRDLLDRLPKSVEVDLAVCPPLVYLSAIAEALQGSVVKLGAQNMYHEAEGAFTGEVSGPMLRDVGCEFVILGHSERRQYFGDSDETVKKKTHAALKCSLIPIVCVGETLNQREQNLTERIIETQVRGSLAGLSSNDAKRIVVAYEPVWAIGTGRTATPAQAEEVHAQIRGLLDQLFGSEASQTIRILYGGSVKADNAAELLSQLNIDGALVGGASLQADSFSKICLASRQAATV